MSAFTFYLSIPITNDLYEDFVDITDYVLENSVGDLKQQLASNDYDVGSIKFNKIKVDLDNRAALFSNAANPLSMFNFKRDQAILRIDWDRNTDPIECGNFYCGHTFLSAPIEVYKGLLEDNSSAFNSNDHTQTFTFLGMESIVGKTKVDYSKLTLGENVEELAFNILNQLSITKFFSVDASNISVRFNFIPDSIEPLRNKKCLVALDELLFYSGAVLFFKDGEIIISDREVGDVSKFTFYGPSSDLGIENIISLSGFTDGLNRCFNSWIWKDSNIVQEFQDSIERFGFREKEIGSDLVTNPITITSILNSLLTEFGFPKKELNLTVPMTSPIVKDIFFLDKVNIDFPSDYRGNPDETLPARYGSAIYGQDTYIHNVSSLIIKISENWKILNRAVSIKNHQINFKIREV